MLSSARIVVRGFCYSVRAVSRKIWIPTPPKTGGDSSPLGSFTIKTRFSRFGYFSSPLHLPRRITISVYYTLLLLYYKLLVVTRSYLYLRVRVLISSATMRDIRRRGLAACDAHGPPVKTLVPRSIQYHNVVRWRREEIVSSAVRGGREDDDDDDHHRPTATAETTDDRNNNNNKNMLVGFRRGALV